MAGTGCALAAIGIYASSLAAGTVGAVLLGKAVWNSFRLDNNLLEFLKQNNIAISPLKFLTDVNERIRVAKLCAQQNGERTALFIEDFGIENEDALIEIAKFCAQQDGHGTAHYILNFGIQEEKARIKIAKLCAQQNGKGTAKFIQNFGIKNEDALIEIAKLCAQQDGKGTVEFIQNFGIQDESALDEILTLAVIQNSCSLVHKTTDQLQLIFIMSRWDQSKAQGCLTSFINTRLSSLGFDWVIPLLDSIEDAHAKKQLTISLAAALFLLRRRLSDEQLLAANQHGLIQAVYSMHAPQFYLPFIDEIIQFCLNREAMENFAKEKTFISKHPHSLLIKACLSEMDYLNDKSISFFNLPKNAKLFKDGPKARLLLYVLRRLRSSSSLSADQKQAVLERIIHSSDIYATLCQLQIIFDLGEASRLRHLTQDLKYMSYKAINQKVPIGEITDAAFKIADTFGKSRKPQAIWQYAAKMLQTNDPRVMECLGAFIASVAEDTFLNIRYDLGKNPHLQKLGKDTVDLWKEGISEDSVKENRGAFNPLEWLRTKLIVDKHMNLTGMDSLSQYLQADGVNKRLQLYNACRKNGFEKICMDLTMAKTPEEQRLHLSKILTALKETRQSTEFQNDIEGQLQLLDDSLREGSRVIDTDNPYDLLLCGTEVPGSCQRIDGDPHLNKGLLGYLMNGQTRLLAIVDKKGSIVARSLLRILWDGEKPVLFLERHYGDSRYEKAIKKLAKAKAKKMKLVLTSLQGDGKLYSKPLQSLGGLAPFEYCDGDAGVKPKGVFTINNARVCIFSNKKFQ